MGKKDVIWPGQFKLAGKDRPGRGGGLTDLRKENFAQEESKIKRDTTNPEPAAAARKRSQKAKPKAKAGRRTA
jgi:hypothetical protein